MVKTKKFKEEGQVIEIEEEQAPVVEVSQTQAKKLTKKPMSEKQAENVKKLVEANRIKWALKKAQMQAKTEMKEENKNKLQVVVKPKRVYPPRKKKVQEEPSITNDEDETESESEEEIRYQKPKPKPKVKKQEAEQIKNKLNELENKIKEQNPVGFRFFNR